MHTKTIMFFFGIIQWDHLLQQFLSGRSLLWTGSGYICIGGKTGFLNAYRMSSITVVQRPGGQTLTRQIATTTASP